LEKGGLFSAEGRKQKIRARSSGVEDDAVIHKFSVDEPQQKWRVNVRSMIQS
jgi:hypothetical protein